MNLKKQAFWFVVIMGGVSLLADMTYESARSLNGQYLAVLGAGPLAVGVVAGLGELLGYGLRFISGLLADRTRRYWAVAITGYAVNLIAVPALALAGRWEIAAALMMAERLGKAIRTPSRDVMLSHAGLQVGAGRAFAIHEALDQVGAVIGPLIITAVFAAGGGYARAYGLLVMPAGLALTVLAAARVIYPRPQDFEPTKPAPAPPVRSRPFLVYLAAMALIAAGFADFPLIAYHLKVRQVFSEPRIPLLYALAMGVDALAAMILGWWFDRKGLKVLIAAVALSAFFAPLAFSTDTVAIGLGMVLWGVGMGVQESIVKAALTRLVPSDQRGTAFGVFHAVFGLTWFVGSALMGYLYAWSPVWLVGFSVTLQLAALPLLSKIRQM